MSNKLGKYSHFKHKNSKFKKYISYTTFYLKSIHRIVELKLDL